MSVFECPECGKTITVTFLSPGEVAQCKGCGAEIKVPEGDEKPTLVSSGKPILASSGRSKTDDGTTAMPLSPGKSTEDGGQPAVRFRALRSIALAYKTVAGVVAFIAAVIAIGILILFSDGSILVGILAALAIAAVGGVMVLVLLSIGDAIMVHISIEENTRATWELLQRRETEE
jgi:DNA-directed RNA polymerase subunit M/transcription elongation factor TFIIS